MAYSDEEAYFVEEEKDNEYDKNYEKYLRNYGKYNI